MAKRIRAILIQDDSDDVESLQHDIRAAYPDHYVFSERVYFVLTDDLSSEVAKKIDAYDESGNGRSAGVFVLSGGGSSGYIDADVWDWLEGAVESIRSASA